MSSGEPPVHFHAALQGWPELTGFPERPPRLDEAQAAFDRGIEAYARGASFEARSLFLRAAELIPADVPGSYGASLDRLREIARANASLAGATEPP